MDDVISHQQKKLPRVGPKVNTGVSFKPLAPSFRQTQSGGHALSLCLFTGMSCRYSQGPRGEISTVNERLLRSFERWGHGRGTCWGPQAPMRYERRGNFAMTGFFCSERGFPMSAFLASAAYAAAWRISTPRLIWRFDSWDLGMFTPPYSLWANSLFPFCFHSFTILRTQILARKLIVNKLIFTTNSHSLYERSW